MVFLESVLLLIFALHHASAATSNASWSLNPNPAPSATMQVRQEFEECLGAGKCKNPGQCDYCGKHGKCCRRYSGTKFPGDKECSAADEGGVDRHECVADYNEVPLNVFGTESKSASPMVECIWYYLFYEGMGMESGYNALLAASNHGTFGDHVYSSHSLGSGAWPRNRLDTIKRLGLKGTYEAKFDTIHSTCCQNFRWGRGGNTGGKTNIEQQLKAAYFGCDWDEYGRHIRTQYIDRSTNCVDKGAKGAPGGLWHDADGPAYTCDRYAKDNSMLCKTSGNDHRNFGMTAVDACCACRGYRTKASLMQLGEEAEEVARTSAKGGGEARNGVINDDEKEAGNATSSGSEKVGASSAVALTSDYSADLKVALQGTEDRQHLKAIAAGKLSDGERDKSSAHEKEATSGKRGLADHPRSLLQALKAERSQKSKQSTEEGNAYMYHSHNPHSHNPHSHNPHSHSPISADTRAEQSYYAVYGKSKAKDSPLGRFGNSPNAAKPILDCLKYMLPEVANRVEKEAKGKGMTSKGKFDDAWRLTRTFCCDLLHHLGTKSSLGYKKDEWRAAAWYTCESVYVNARDYHWRKDWWEGTANRKNYYKYEWNGISWAGKSIYEPSGPQVGKLPWWKYRRS